MNILALDLGKKNTGWANSHNGTMVSGHISFSYVDSHGELFSEFNEFLRDQYELYPWDIALYLYSHLKGSAAISIIVGMQAILQAFCYSFDIKVDSVHDGTLKKYATGKGNASKDEMMEAYLQDRKCSPISHDEADAYWLMKYGVEKIGAGTS